MSLGLEFTGSYDATQRNFNRLDAHTELTGTAHSIAVISALPVSPVEGQQVYFVADATNGIVWHLKYRAASASAYKWEVVGGSPLYAEVITTAGTVSTTYTNQIVGPSITLPLSGDYDVEVGSQVDNAANNSFHSYAIGGVGAVDADASVTYGSGYDIGSRVRRKTGLTAVALVSKYRAGAGTATFRDPWMRVMPVRVS